MSSLDNRLWRVVYRIARCISVVARCLREQGTATTVMLASAVVFASPFAASGLGFAAPQNDVVPVAHLSETPLFDSGQHPSANVSVLGSLSLAMILNESRIVLLDGTTLLFIDPWTSELWTAGREGGGPGEFVGSGLELSLFRGEQSQLVVWDFSNGFRLTVFSDSGDVLDTRRVNLSPLDFHHPLAISRLWEVFPSGGLAFLDGGPPIGGGGNDLGRPPGYVVEVSPEGEVRTIVEYQGRETGDLLFAHDTHVAIQGEWIVVGDTESEHIKIFDRSGTIVSRIPMPGERARVSEEHLEAALGNAHERAIRSHESSREHYEALRLPTKGLEFRERRYRHNEVAPPIDAIRVDGDARLWVRHYVLPGDQVERWTVWDDGGEGFLVELPVGEAWMDARGNLVLLRVRNSLGVDRAVIRGMVLPRR